MRQFLNKYGVIIAVVVLLFSALLIYFFGGLGGRRSGGVMMAYYIDESSNEESVHPMTDEPPLMNKDGKPTLVRVVKVSCDGGKTVKAAYYEKYSPQAKSVLEAHKDGDAARTAVVISGMMVRSPEPGSKWVLQNGPAGAEVMARTNCPGGENPVVALPPIQ